MVELVTDRIRSMVVMACKRMRAGSALLVMLGWLALSQWFSGCSGKTSAPAGARPNIVLVMADDMGFSDLGCYGSEIATPNLDRLAANGLRFTQFYNAARCCPTRASLLTGLYPHQVGFARMVSRLGKPRPAGPAQGYLGRNGATIAEALAPAGYRSYMSGKWHVGEDPENWPLRRGFHRYFGLISGASSYYEILKNQSRVRQMVLDSVRWEPPAQGFYVTDAISDFAVQRIDEHERTQSDNPFFLYVAYTAPHWPLHAPKEEIDKYRGFYDIGWDSLRTLRYDKLRTLGVLDSSVGVSQRTGHIPSWNDVENKADWSLRMSVYAGMVDRMDQGIGKIVEALERHGAMENTVILFLSDNGGCAEEITGRKLHVPGSEIGARGSYVAYREPWANASNTPFRYYKQWVHEGGIATPLIVHWPAKIVHRGGFSPQVGTVADLMPTILDIAGAAYPDSIGLHRIDATEGVSLVPVFTKNTVFPRNPLFWEHYGNRAVRDGQWKLVAPKDGPWELYDLASDRAERNNLADSEPAKLKDLEHKYDEWASRVGAK